MGPRTAWTLAGVVGATVSFVATLAFPPHHLAGVVEADPSVADAAVHSGLGLLFVLLGSRAAALRPSNHTGALLLAVGLLWFLPDVSLIPSAVAFTFAYWAGPLYLAPLAHAFLIFPGGRLRSHGERVLVWLLYGWLTVGMLVEVLFYDPRADGCEGCPQNLLLVDADRTVGDVVRATNAGIGVCFVVVIFTALLRHWRRSSGLGRRVMTPVTWAGATAGLVPLTMAIGTAYDWPDQVEAVLWTFSPLALAALPICLFVGVVRSRLDHALVSELVMEFEKTRRVGELQDAMVRALRDPTARLYFWLPDKGQFVDSSGNPVELPEATEERAVTLLQRDGERIAALVHHSWLEEEPTLVGGVVGAASIALENERLHAKVRSQLEDVRASRARIVEAADAERRRLERDLHDGAQQRLVNLSLMLRMLDAGLAHGDGSGRSLLKDAQRELANGLEELRELARGIHPAVLTQDGLSPALESLAERSPVPVRIKETPARRFSAAVEATVYFTVSEALTNVVKHARPTEATVAVRHEGRTLMVEVRDDGVGGADASRGSGLRGLADRIAAIDGRLELTSPPGGGTCLIAEIPCE